MLGDVRFLTDAEIATAREAAPAWTTFPHPAPTTHEKELRARLAEFVRRAYRQRLFISTQGSFSARVDAGELPHHSLSGRSRHHRRARSRPRAQRRKSKPAPLPAAPRASTMPSTASTPSSGSIINAYPVNATAFSVTGAAAR